MEIKCDFYLNKLISFPEGFDGEVKEVYGNYGRRPESI